MKKWMIIPVLMVLLAGCAGASKTANVQSNSESDYCPTLYVPPSVVPEEYESSGYSASSFEYYLDDDVLNSKIKWDGWQWASSSFSSNNMYCSPGDSEGENVNYIYCTGLDEIEKSFTDSSGNVVEHRMYHMTLVYAPVDAGFILKEIQYRRNQFSQEPDCITKP